MPKAFPKEFREVKRDFTADAPNRLWLADITELIDVAGYVLHSDRGSRFRSRKLVHQLNRHQMVGSMGRVGAAGGNAAMESVFSLLQNSV